MTSEYHTMLHNNISAIYKKYIKKKKKKNRTYLHNNISAIAHPLDQINQKVNYNY